MVIHKALTLWGRNKTRIRVVADFPDKAEMSLNYQFLLNCHF